MVSAFCWLIRKWDLSGLEDDVMRMAIGTSTYLHSNDGILSVLARDNALTLDDAVFLSESPKPRDNNEKRDDSSSLVW
jgi:hypothetical protein